MYWILHNHEFLQVILSEMQSNAFERSVKGAPNLLPLLTACLNFSIITKR